MFLLKISIGDIDISRICFATLSSQWCRIYIFAVRSLCCFFVLFPNSNFHRSNQLVENQVSKVNQWFQRLMSSENSPLIRWNLCDVFLKNAFCSYVFLCWKQKNGWEANQGNNTMANPPGEVFLPPMKLTANAPTRKPCQIGNDRLPTNPLSGANLLLVAGRVTTWS